MRSLREAILVFVVVATIPACARGPYDLARFRHDAAKKPGRSLVRYLSGPNADASVCDPASESFALGRFGAADVDALLEALDESRIRPDVFRACATHLFPSFEAPLAAHALDASVTSLTKHAMRADERDYEDCLALHEVIEARPPGTFLSRDAVRLAVATRAAPGVTQVGRTVLDDLVLTSELDHGRFRGGAADAASLADVDDPVLLRRMLKRFPTPEQRLAAKSRFVDLAIAASSWPEVHADPNAVHDRVVATGRNAVDLAVHPIARANSIAGPPLSVYVELRVEERTVRFFARTEGDATNLPRIDLRPRLRFDVEGHALPLAFCGPASDLDVTPCVSPADVARDVVGSRLDDDAIVHFDGAPFDELLTLISPERRYALPLRADAHAETLAWPLNVLVPPPTVFSDGRDIEVEVTALHGFYVARIRGAHGAPLGTLMLDAEATPETRVITRGRMGTQGAPGTRGIDGAAGTLGTSASCPSTGGGAGGPGGNGTMGGRGGNGGPGGNGGDVRIVLRCERPACAPMRAHATDVVRSEAGPGGPAGSGGDGGRGGNGGAGGYGTACAGAAGAPPVLLPAGVAGARGLDGARGFDGTPGRPGRAGNVTVVVRAPERPPATPPSEAQPHPSSAPTATAPSAPSAPTAAAPSAPTASPPSAPTAPPAPPSTPAPVAPTPPTPPTPPTTPAPTAPSAPPSTPAPTSPPSAPAPTAPSAAPSAPAPTAPPAPPSTPSAPPLPSDEPSPVAPSAPPSPPAGHVPSADGGTP